jgi:hypothetical protein
MFCFKTFQSSEFLHAHYKKRHADSYSKEGLENQENIQLMANLLQAADVYQASNNHSDIAQADGDDLILKLKEEVVDKFTQDLTRLQLEIQNMRALSQQEENVVMRTLDEVRSKEDERIQDAKYAVEEYVKIADRFKKDIEKEVESYRANIVADVESKLAEALDNEEKKEQK